MKLVYQEARDQAASILDANWDGHFPVKLAPITAALGATKLESHMAAGISGVVVKQTNGSPSIVINRDEPATRQRFTWAHELGHIVERAAVAKDDDYSYIEQRGAKYDLHEFFADEFAGALLMPPADIARCRATSWTVPQMANHFGVSVPAVYKRIESIDKRK